MRKLGPIMAIGSGLLAIVVGIMTLLVAHNVIDGMTWLTEYNVKNPLKDTNLSVDVTYGIHVGFGVLAVMLGVFTFKSGRGFAAFILLIIFTAITAFSLYTGFKDDSWATMSIVSVSVYSVATFGLLLGVFAPKN